MGAACRFPRCSEDLHRLASPLRNPIILPRRHRLACLDRHLRLRYTHRRGHMRLPPNTRHTDDRERLIISDPMKFGTQEPPLLDRLPGYTRPQRYSDMGPPKLIRNEPPLCPPPSRPGTRRGCQALPRRRHPTANRKASRASLHLGRWIWEGPHLAIFIVAVNS